MPRKIKPFLCIECGETDPDKFYHDLKQRCKRHENKHKYEKSKYKRRIALGKRQGLTREQALQKYGNLIAEYFKEKK